MKMSNMCMKGPVFCTKPFMLLVLMMIVSISALGQSLSVGFPGLENYYRRAQVLGLIDSTFSFTARPFDPVSTLGNSDPYDPDSSLVNDGRTAWNGKMTIKNDRSYLTLLPVSVKLAYKAPVPISMNDGPMIPARGFQSVASGGIYGKFGPVSIRLQPEVFFAQNATYNGFPEYHSDLAWQAYYHVHNYIDLPEHFGNKSFSRYLPGQSNFKLSMGSVSFGISTENLWWGPGYYNSLLMTNSAPGFFHAFVNTSRPIKTAIGNFEGQLIAGRLDSSGFEPPLNHRNNMAGRFFDSRNSDWRYFNGLIVTYMPKWVPGLFFGATRAYHFYGDALNVSYTNYMPVILPLQQNRTNNDQERVGRDQLASLFMRWVIPKAQTELYLEYGREDRSHDFRDLMLDFTHSRAYLAGLRKMFQLTGKEYLEIGLELTQLENLRTKRSQWWGMDPSWYVHSQIRHGYTHSGQMLGAGIGPGSNMQTLRINWVKGIKTVGLQLDRYIHNNDLLHNAGLDARSIWMDLILTGVINWDWKNLLINARLSAVRSYNYQWYYARIPNPDGSIDKWAKGKNVHSLQGQLGLVYRW
jgi:hypothetical protein